MPLGRSGRHSGGDWDDSGIHGHSRWLNRVWNLALDTVPPRTDPASAERIRRLTHQMVKKTTTDIEDFRFNTMLAAMMEFTNALAEERRADTPIDVGAWREAIETLVLCLAPLAPHITEELWQRLGKPYSVHTQTWPSWDDALAREETITLVVQVNGKVRDTIQVAPGLNQEDAQSLAHDSEKVAAHLEGKTLRKAIFVPDKLLNLVVG